MNLSGIRSGITARGRRGLRRAWLLGVTMSLALILGACGDVVPSTNTYPIDFFSEMHYMKSWGAGEPDGWNPPEGSVPITGGEVEYSIEEAAELENPYEDATADVGADLYAVNCSHCHGPEGDGEGPVAPFLEGGGSDPIANLQEMPNDFNDGELFHVVTYGLGDYMPPFKRLMTPEQRWAVVEYIREFEE
jgi:mono/diheme cytochrome c family protein